MRRKDTMSTGASRYPISQLLARILDQSGLSRSEFVKSLGLKNVPKGLRRLDEILDTGCGEDTFLQRVVEVYRIDPVELADALDATETIYQEEHQTAIRAVEDRERRRFRPFIWIQTEDGAHSFFQAMLERKVKVLWLREAFTELSRDEQ